MTVRTIDEIFRDFVTDGVPASGPFNPHKPDIRDTLKALTEGSENFPDNRVIRLNNANEGTANNIVVTASVAIPAAAYQVLYILNVTQENTGPVTVSGAINRDLVTNTSRPIEPGYLKPGMALLCIDTGSELRMLSYGDVEEVVEALAVRAEAAAEAAEAAAGNNWSSFDSVISVQAANIPVPVNYLRTAGYYAPGDGGAALYKRVAVEPSHAGKVQSADGSWWELASLPVKPEYMGAVADGVTDATAAIQSAIDVALALKTEVVLGVGTYLISDSLSITYNTLLTGKSIIRGQGQTISKIYATHPSNAGLFIKGSWGGSEQVRGNFSDFSIEMSSSNADAIFLKELSYLTFDRISIRGARKGIYAEDAISVGLYNCVITHNKVGVHGARASYSYANSWTAVNCTINANTLRGAQMDKAATFTVIGGQFEGNGTMGEPDTPCAIYMNGGPEEGAVGLSAMGVYFEGQKGFADIYLDSNDAANVVHDIQGCTFNRISSTAYVSHNVLIDKKTTGSRLTVNVRGCGFGGFNSYTANTSRPYVAFRSSPVDDLYEISLLGNGYGSSVEEPNIPGSVASNKAYLGAWARVVGSTGNLLEGHNIKSVTRTAVGTYKIEFKKNFERYGHVVTGSPVGGAGSVYLEDENYGYVIVKTANSSGTVADLTGFSVSVNSG